MAREAEGRFNLVFESATTMGMRRSAMMGGSHWN